MTITRTLIALSILALASACGGSGEPPEVPEAQPAGATSANIGDHVVHFSAQTTDQLPPEVARAYNIVRSKNRAMLTVSVLRESDNVSVPADVSVKTVNLTGQLKNVEMRQIEEQEAVYYIGEFPVHNLETYRFEIIVAIQGEPEPLMVRFKQQFYTE